jgi:hypothetical protein
VRAPTERSLLTACKQFITLRGGYVIRINSGGAVAVNRAGRRRFVRMNSEPGCADLLCCYRGHFLAVEVKRPGGRLTPAQASFLRAVEAAGGKALVIDDLRQLQEALDGLGG